MKRCHCYILMLYTHTCNNPLNVVINHMKYTFVMEEVYFSLTPIFIVQNDISAPKL